MSDEEPRLPLQLGHEVVSDGGQVVEQLVVATIRHGSEFSYGSSTRPVATVVVRHDEPAVGRKHPGDLVIASRVLGHTVAELHQALDGAPRRSLGTPDKDVDVGSVISGDGDGVHSSSQTAHPGQNRLNHTDVFIAAITQPGRERTYRSAHPSPGRV